MTTPEDLTANIARGEDSRHQFRVTIRRSEVQRGGVSEGVSEGVPALLELIRQKPGLRVPDMAQALNTPPKTIERWLKQLREAGRIEFVGPPKTGGYHAQDATNPGPPV